MRTTWEAAGGEGEGRGGSERMGVGRGRSADIWPRLNDGGGVRASSGPPVTATLHTSGLYITIRGSAES